MKFSSLGVGILLFIGSATAWLSGCGGGNGGGGGPAPAGGQGVAVNPLVHVCDGTPSCAPGEVARLQASTAIISTMVDEDSLN